MSLQWTAVATFLYAEVFAVLLLCIPFISPKRYGLWSKQASKWEGTYLGAF
jgi:B-cell receptor-associated protein 31